MRFDYEAGDEYVKAQPPNGRVTQALFGLIHIISDVQKRQVATAEFPAGNARLDQLVAAIASYLWEVRMLLVPEYEDFGLIYYRRKSALSLVNSVYLFYVGIGIGGYFAGWWALWLALSTIPIALTVLTMTRVSLLDGWEIVNPRLSPARKVLCEWLSASAISAAIAAMFWGVDYGSVSAGVGVALIAVILVYLLGYDLPLRRQRYLRIGRYEAAEQRWKNYLQQVAEMLEQMVGETSYIKLRQELNSTVDDIYWLP